MYSFSIFKALAYTLSGITAKQREFKTLQTKDITISQISNIEPFGYKCLLETTKKKERSLNTKI